MLVKYAYEDLALERVFGLERGLAGGGGRVARLAFAPGGRVLVLVAHLLREQQTRLEEEHAPLARLVPRELLRELQQRLFLLRLPHLELVLQDHVAQLRELLRLCNVPRSIECSGEFVIQVLIEKLLWRTYTYSKSM